MADSGALLKAKAHISRRMTWNTHILGAFDEVGDTVTLRCVRCTQVGIISPSIVPNTYIVAGEALNEACGY